jgi:predicted N-acetyltransferase YhbS
MEIRGVRIEEIEEARALLTQEPGWAARFDDAEEFRRLISKSQRALVAIQDGRIVGFVRAITDDMSNGYLTLLIVRNTHRGRGIGRALVHAVMGEDTGMTWVLRADRGAETFYEQIGFVRSQVAMERPRAKATLQRYGTQVRQKRSFAPGQPSSGWPPRSRNDRTRHLGDNAGMPKPLKISLAILTGFVTWFVAATIANLLIRALIPGYAEAEPTMLFTLPMLFARLTTGAFSSVVAGLACALIARAHFIAVKILAVVLVLFFLPIHYSLFAQFPLWYHAVFLISLAPLVLAGGWLALHRT